MRSGGRGAGANAVEFEVGLDFEEEEVVEEGSVEGKESIWAWMKRWDLDDFELPLIRIGSRRVEEVG